MSELSISVCIFRKNKEDNWEQGVMINDDKLIINMQGEIIRRPIYNYQLRTYKGVMIVKEDQHGTPS